jgi:hypothetical protein
MPDFEYAETIVDLFGPLRRDGLLPNTVYVSNLVEWLETLPRSRCHTRMALGGTPSTTQHRVLELQVRAIRSKRGGPGTLQRAEEGRSQEGAKKAPKRRLSGAMSSAADGETLDLATVAEPHGGSGDCC